MKFLEQHVLLPTDHYNALGIAHHVADVYLPSLQDAVADTPPPAAAAMALLQPFCAALASVGEDSTLKRYRCAYAQRQQHGALATSLGASQLQDY